MHVLVWCMPWYGAYHGVVHVMVWCISWSGACHGVVLVMVWCMSWCGARHGVVHVKPWPQNSSSVLPHCRVLYTGLTHHPFNSKIAGARLTDSQ